MRLIVLSLVASMTALAACSEPATDALPAETPATPPADNRPAPDEPATPAPDECGAAERQDWIGRLRADLPSAPAGALWRIYETGQPVTQDLRANRLNIEIDPERQTVVRLTCG